MIKFVKEFFYRRSWFNWRYGSFCSGHKLYNYNCKLCQSGYWSYDIPHVKIKKGQKMIFIENFSGKQFELEILSFCGETNKGDIVCWVKPDKEIFNNL